MAWGDEAARQTEEQMLRELHRGRGPLKVGGFGCFGSALGVVVMIFGILAANLLGFVGEGLPTFSVDPTEAGFPEIGSCFTEFDGTKPIPVPCDEPHMFELTAVTEIDRRSDEYPGRDFIRPHATNTCQSAGRGYFQPNDGPPNTAIMPGYPTAESWATGDRILWCAVFEKPLNRLDTGRLWPGVSSDSASQSGEAGSSVQGQQDQAEDPSEPEAATGSDLRLAGAWRSVGVVANDPAAGEYTILLILTASSTGAFAGSVEYEELTCAGSLTFVRQDGQTLVFDERITSGLSRCTNGQTKLTPIGDDRLSWQWTNGSLTLSEELVRAGS